MLSCHTSLEGCAKRPSTSHNQDMKAEYFGQTISIGLLQMPNNTWKFAYKTYHTSMDSNCYCLRQSTITSMEDAHDLLSSNGNVHGLIQSPSTAPIVLLLHGIYHELYEPMALIIYVHTYFIGSFCHTLNDSHGCKFWYHQWLCPLTILIYHFIFLAL